MCVILSAKTPSRLEPVLADKEVLLTTLNIKAMAFSGIEDAEGGDKDDETETNVTQITNVSTSNLANSLKHRQAPKHLKSLPNLLESRFIEYMFIVNSLVAKFHIT